MIDPGATHNFISLDVVNALGLPKKNTEGFGVSLGNGETVRGEGICKGVRINLNGGVEVVAEFLPLGLGSSDIILGVQWLETLGVMMTNWKTQVMKYEVRGEPVTLIGDSTLVCSKISLKAMFCSLKKSGGYSIECGKMEVNQVETSRSVGGISQPLASTIRQFAGVLKIRRGCHRRGIMNMLFY